jgi:hypothetical protein
MFDNLKRVLAVMALVGSVVVASEEYFFEVAPRALEPSEAESELRSKSLEPKDVAVIVWRVKDKKQKFMDIRYEQL